MGTPSYKTIHAFKKILEALGPGGFNVEHFHNKKVYDPIATGRGVEKRIWATTFYKPKRICIYKQSGYLDSIDTILHECLHAAYAELDEEEITKLTEEICADLWGNE